MSEGTEAPTTRASTTSRGGFGRGGRSGGQRGKRNVNPEKEEWIPVTKLGRLVKAGKVASIEQIFLYAIPIKEYQILDYFLKNLNDEVIKVMSVQKQTCAGQRTRFKAFVVIGDGKGHLGLGSKCSKEVATAIRGAIVDAKLSIVPVRLGYWGNHFDDPHTVPCKVSGRCGSVMVRLIPAPRGTGIVAATTVKKLLTMAGIQDCYTKTSGTTKTMGNLARACYAAVAKTYTFLTPNLWSQAGMEKDLYQQHSSFLAKHGHR